MSNPFDPVGGIEKAADHILDHAREHAAADLPSLALAFLNALCGYKIRASVEITVDRRTVDGIEVTK